jgi:glycosyltransferase involved in cell wall biosynthesis
MGQNGGGAFVLVYLLCILLIGIPVMMSEVLIGRRGRQSPGLSVKTLALEANGSTRWQLAGWSGLVASYLILSFYAVIAGWALYYVFKTASGDFVGMPAAFVARVQARVYTRHHSNFHQYYKMRLGLLADKITNIFATKVIAVSKIVNDILVSQERVPQSKVKIIYNGVAINEFPDASVDIDSSRGFLSNYADSIEIGVISRLTELKGVSYTAKAFVKFSREFPNAHLSIVGAKADSFDEISRILSNVPSYRYHFVDFNDDIPSFLKSIDILVHVPIAIDIESFGLVYIEGLASGVPSVFTVSGILNEIPELYKYAQVVPSMDSEAIYLAMKRLVIDSCKSIHRCPTELLSEFKIEEMADSYFEVILP